MKRKSTTLARLTLVAAQGAPHQIFAFHAIQGCFSLFLVGHFDKAEATRASGLAVMDNLGTVNGAIGLKSFAEGDVVHAPSEISYKNVHVK